MNKDIQLQFDEYFDVQVCKSSIDVYKYAVNVKNNRSFILVPGWGEGIEVVGTLAYHLSSIFSAPVYVIDYRKLNNPNVLAELKSEDAQNIYAACPDIYCKALAIKYLIEKYGTKNIFLLSHSEGALVAATLMNAFNFGNKNIFNIFMAPAVTKSGFVNLVFNFLKYFLYRTITYSSGRQIEYYKQSFLFVIKNPFQLIRNARCIPKINLINYLRNMEKKHQKFVIILFEDDILFKLNKMKKYLKEFKNKIIIFSGGHAEMHIHSLSFLHKLKKELLKYKIDL